MVGHQVIRCLTFPPRLVSLLTIHHVHVSNLSLGFIQSCPIRENLSCIFHSDAVQILSWELAQNIGHYYYHLRKCETRFWLTGVLKTK
jgi:hypothetical protein